MTLQYNHLVNAPQGPVAHKLQLVKGSASFQSVCIATSLKCFTMLVFTRFTIYILELSDNLQNIHLFIAQQEYPDLALTPSDMPINSYSVFPSDRLIHTIHFFYHSPYTLSPIHRQFLAPILTYLEKQSN